MTFHNFDDGSATVSYWPNASTTTTATTTAILTALLTVSFGSMPPSSTSMPLDATTGWFDSYGNNRSTIDGGGGGDPFIGENYSTFGNHGLTDDGEPTFWPPSDRCDPRDMKNFHCTVQEFLEYARGPQQMPLSTALLVSTETFTMPSPCKTIKPYINYAGIVGWCDPTRGMGLDYTVFAEVLHVGVSK